MNNLKIIVDLRRGSAQSLFWLQLLPNENTRADLNENIIELQGAGGI